MLFESSANGWAYGGRVAQDHYLQITDSHFEKAINDTERRAAQNPAQQAHEPGRTASQRGTAESEKTPAMPGLSTACDSTRNERMTPTGSEHPQKPSEKPQVSNPGGTESGTIGTPPPGQRGLLDPELAQIVALWSQLPASARTALLALAKAAARCG